MPPMGIFRIGGGRMPSYSGGKQEILVRLRRMEGQLRGIQRMVEEDRHQFLLC